MRRDTNYEWLAFRMVACILIANAAFPSFNFAESCKPVAGLYPLGARVQKFYDYQHYTGVLPPVVHRDARSLQCGQEKGTLYLLKFASDAERDKAEIFAKTMVDHDLGRQDPDSIREIPKGFIIVSFRTFPPALEQVLAVPESTDTSSFEGTVEVPQVSTTVAAASVPLIEANEALASGATPAPAEPGLVSGPSTENHLPAAPPPTPLKPVHAAQPVKKKHPTHALKPKPVAKPASAPPAVPMAKVADLDPSAMAYFADHMHCGFATRSQLRPACRWLGGFASGTKPDWPLKPGSVWIGKTWVIDSSGHLQAEHYNILADVQDPLKAGFLNYTPVNATEASELDALIAALEKHEAAPSTALIHKLLETTSRQTVAAAPTFGPSWRLSGNGQTFYLRQADDHGVLLSIIGTPSTQTYPILVVSVLYSTVN